MNNPTEDLTGIISSMMDQIKILNSSPDKKDLPKSQYPNNVVPDKNKAPQLEVGHSMKVRDMWNLKHVIKSQKLYKLLIKT